MAIKRSPGLGERCRWQAKDQVQILKTCACAKGEPVLLLAVDL